MCVSDGEAGRRWRRWRGVKVLTGVDDAEVVSLCSIMLTLGIPN